MCTPRQSALTQPRYDDIHQADDMRISTYAGRYAITPNMNCPSTYPINPTIRIQSSGDSWVSGQWKTDVESDLRGVGRPPTKWRCDSMLYNPMNNTMNSIPLTNAEDEGNGIHFNRLNNPPCTLRATGWNRWQPLFHNPQAVFETPFDFFIPSKDIDKMRYKTHVSPGKTYMETLVEKERSTHTEVEMR